MSSELDIEHHLEAFAKSFVLDSRKEKWVDLLRERPDTLFMQASKLFNYLDHNFIEQNDLLENVASNDTIGVFYDFQTEPRILSFDEAKKEKSESDAIFSIDPGALVIYFYHEDWNFVCRK